MTITRARAARTGPGGAGLTLAVASAATFGTSGTFASSLIRAGWSPGAAVLTRIAVSYTHLNAVDDVAIACQPRPPALTATSYLIPRS